MQKFHSYFSTILLLLSYFLLFPFSVRVDASHPHSFVLNKFLDSFERERCEGLKREWSSVPQRVDCVSAFASRHW